MEVCAYGPLNIVLHSFMSSCGAGFLDKGKCAGKFNFIYLFQTNFGFFPSLLRVRLGQLIHSPLVVACFSYPTPCLPFVMKSLEAPGFPKSSNVVLLLCRDCKCGWCARRGFNYGSFRYYEFFSF